MREILEILARGDDLPANIAAQGFDAVFDGSASDAEIGALLMGLRQKGESITEISAAVKAMRARMIKATVRSDAIDVCGTGGDGAQTLNVSTAVAIVVAACGVPVAKHGNKAASSASGATDVLSVLGVKTDAPQIVVERCVNELGIGYFAAPLYHPALAKLAPIRKSLGIRTLFNLLGPMCNPAGVSRQMVGISMPNFIETYAKVLKQNGSAQAIVMCGAAGIDEFCLDGENHAYEFSGDTFKQFIVRSDEFGLAPAPLAAIKGGTPSQNAAALLELLSGKMGAYRDTVLFNALFALSLGLPSATDEARLALAANAIDSGKAGTLLTAWIEMSHKL